MKPKSRANITHHMTVCTRNSPFSLIVADVHKCMHASELWNCCHLLCLGVRFILITISIRDTKTAAIIEPAMLLSIEHSAFQNQIAKRISITKSIAARSECGPDILVGSKLVLFEMILFKLFSP